MNIMPKKDKPVTVRLDDDTYKKMESYAIQDKESISFEIRKAINYYLDSKNRLS